MNVEDRRPRLSVVTAVLVFLAARVALLIVRDPFFDELFTVWMARQSFSQIIPLLLNDSGPPLYYFLARFDSVTALRCLSLLFACAQFVLVARFSWTAALLLAVYPPAALFAVDARAYALCGLFVTAGVLARQPYLKALSFVLAAYSHYYGVLFFPLPLAGEGALKGRVRAFLLALVLFIPGFYLASRQPIAATAWVHEPWYASLVNLSFAGRYPEALFKPAPWILVIVSLVLLVISTVGDRARPFDYAQGRRALAAGETPALLAVVVPIVLAIAFQLAGRPVYFPMRFEAVIAGPLVLLLANARLRIVIPLTVIGAFVIAAGAIDHYRRPPDPYREAAMVLKRNAKPADTIVATGYLYLETVAALERPVIAWPAEQALHPGWRATGGNPAELPQGTFLWIGERGAPELVRLQGVRSVQPLFTNERAMIALTRPLH
jgi:hypothetical protein